MTDLTALTTPFGLLDRDTQEALRAHGGPYEWFSGVSGWTVSEHDPTHWHPAYTIRVKAAPPKPREWWVTQDDRGKLLVFDKPVRDDVHEVIHVREVIE